MSDKQSDKSGREQSRAEFMNKLRAMGKLDKEKRNAVVCALIGHSRVQSTCFGYYYCGRCEAQVGDTLGSVYSGAEQAVVIGHNCPKCRANYKALTWKDKLFAPNPFPKATA